MRAFEFTSGRSSNTSDEFIAKIGPNISSKEQLLSRLSEELRFPTYWGSNWDALDEGLRDLHWLKQKRVLLIHEQLPKLSREEMVIYLQILRAAVNEWRRDSSRDLIVIFPSVAEEVVLGLLR